MLFTNFPLLQLLTNCSPLPLWPLALSSAWLGESSPSSSSSSSWNTEEFCCWVLGLHAGNENGWTRRGSLTGSEQLHMVDGLSSHNSPSPSSKGTSVLLDHELSRLTETWAGGGGRRSGGCTPSGGVFAPVSEWFVPGQGKGVCRWRTADFMDIEGPQSPLFMGGGLTHLCTLPTLLLHFPVVLSGVGRRRKCIWLTNRG